MQKNFLFLNLILKGLSHSIQKQGLSCRCKPLQLSDLRDLRQGIGSKELACNRLRNRGLRRKSASSSYAHRATATHSFNCQRSQPQSPTTTCGTGACLRLFQCRLRERRGREESAFCRTKVTAVSQNGMKAGCCCHAEAPARQGQKLVCRDRNPDDGQAARTITPESGERGTKEGSPAFQGWVGIPFSPESLQGRQRCLRAAPRRLNRLRNTVCRWGFPEGAG